MSFCQEASIAKFAYQNSIDIFFPKLSKKNLTRSFLMVYLIADTYDLISCVRFSLRTQLLKGVKKPPSTNAEGGLRLFHWSLNLANSHSVVALASSKASIFNRSISIDSCDFSREFSLHLIITCLLVLQEISLCIQSVFSVPLYCS